MECLSLTPGKVFGLSFLVFSASAVQATTNCSGTLSGTHSDVIVNGVACVLDGADVQGSVLVDSGGSLVATGGTQILGSIQAQSGGDIELGEATVVGEVKLLNSGNVIVGDLADVSNLKVEASGDVEVRGIVGGIESKGSGGIKLDGATLFPGGLIVDSASGAVEICGSSIGDGINVVLSIGDVLVEASMQCAASTVTGSLEVEKGTGNVRVVGATMTGSDLVVVEQTGSVFLEGVSLSDVKVEKGFGDVTLQDVETDSDTKIVEGDGDVNISGSWLGSSVDVSLNNNVVFYGNASQYEVVSISGNQGSVVVDSNCDFVLKIDGNQGVTVTGNNETDAALAGAACNNADGLGVTFVEVSQNTGSVVIDNNVGQFLTCSNNTFPPTGSGNIFVLTDGQCDGL